MKKMGIWAKTAVMAVVLVVWGGVIIGCGEDDTVVVEVKFVPKGSGYYTITPENYKDGDQIFITAYPAVDGKYVFRYWEYNHGGSYYDGDRRYENPTSRYVNVAHSPQTFTAYFLEK